MKKNKLIFIFIFSFKFQILICQDSIWKKPPVLEFTCYNDVFYTFDIAQPKTIKRQDFFYNYNRHNEITLNFGYIKAGLIHSKYRANFALQAGTYVNDNYDASLGALRQVFESNIGISLDKKNKLWLDAGIFASHIGFESAIGIDNWNLTRSIVAENSPYYLSGLKLNYKPNTKWEHSLLLTNGWQKIQRAPYNNFPSIGSQIKYTFNEDNSFNWSTFLTSEYPDSIRKIRTYHNLFTQFKTSKKLAFILGLDFGFEQTKKNSQDFYYLYSPILMSRYKINKKWYWANRIEYYQDMSNVIVKLKSNQGFRTYGFSTNFDYFPIENLVYSFEIRFLKSKDSIYYINNKSVDYNLFYTNSLSFKFN